MRFTKLLSFVTVAALVAAPTFAQRAPLTDAQVRDAMIRESINAYLATGHPSARLVGVPKRRRLGGVGQLQIGLDGLPEQWPIAEDVRYHCYG